MTDAIENPSTGERIEFLQRSPGVLRFAYSLEPDGFAVGRFDHVHPRQEERIEVRSGRLGVRIAGDEWTATPGTRFGIPAGTPHLLWNDGAEAMHATVELRPSYELDAFFETMFGLAREGKTNGWGLPGPLQLAVLVDEFGDAISFAHVPRRLQRTVAALVAPVARGAGYRARYPRFAEDKRSWTLSDWL